MKHRILMRVNEQQARVEVVFDPAIRALSVADREREIEHAMAKANEHAKRELTAA